MGRGHPTLPSSARQTELGGRHTEPRVCFPTQGVGAGSPARQGSATEAAASPALCAPQGSLLPLPDLPFTGNPATPYRGPQQSKESHPAWDEPWVGGGGLPSVSSAGSGGR